MFTAISFGRVRTLAETAANALGKNVNLNKGALRSAPVLPPVELGTLSFELVTLQLVLLSAVLIQHISIPSKLIVHRYVRYYA